MGRRGKQTVEDIAEEFCFVCKDGGDLRVCDFKNCLKAYHPRCVGKEDDFLSSDDQFICDWHKCVICERNTYYQCLCCPNSSVCGDCLGEVEFVQVKQNKGFCNNCLKMAISIEKNADADFDGASVDVRDTETYVFLFKDYWEVIKDKEGLTLVDLQEASVLLKKSLNCKQGRDLEKVPDEDHKADGHLLSYNDDAEQTFLFDTKGNPNEVQASLKRKKSNKKSYVGWGSKELIEFLSCIGKDTTKPLDQFRVVGIVKEYIQQKNLFQDKKKKICHL